MAQALRDRDAITHNYVLVETEALAHRRLGARAVRALRRRSSLVDHVSFELMRRLDLHTALALDDDFAREGFELLPG